MHYTIRVNGTGNAWPTFIGEEHPYYWNDQPQSMANASFSVFGYDHGVSKKESIQWSLLIDAGHGAIQQIIRNENRIPEAILLTHHHLDHTLGIDWVIQSYWYKHDKQKKYPVYASALCWEHTVAAYPHLKGMVDLIELIPGKTVVLNEAEGVKITGLSVYHGPRAYGAMMLVLEFDAEKKVVFTGDCLCPLLRESDINKLKNSNYLFIDSNNRFSYPLSNHFSLSIYEPLSNNKSEYLNDWLQKITMDDLLTPHQPFSGKEYKEYFKELMEENKDLNNLCFSVFDFVQLIRPAKTELVHYGGIEDEKYYRQLRLNNDGLTNWISSRAKEEKVETFFILPKAGEVYKV